MSESIVDRILGEISSTCEAESEVLLDTLDRIGQIEGVRIHVAVMAGPYLDKILDGSKTVESRITKNRLAPYGRISCGDVILFKQSSGPIRALALVKEASCTELRPGQSLEDITQDYLQGLAYEPGYLEAKDGARYFTFLLLDQVTPTAEARLRKRDRQTWVTVGANAHGEAGLLEPTSTTAELFPESPAIPATWILISGFIASGKTSIAHAVGAHLNIDTVSFGDVVRGEAVRLGLPADRSSLQNLGAHLYDQVGPEGLVDLLLDSVTGPAVIEGIRHVRVLQLLRDRCSPSLAVFVDASQDTRHGRFVSRSRSDDAGENLDDATSHAVESEVGLLRSACDFLVDSESQEPADVAQAVAARLVLSSPVPPSAEGLEENRCSSENSMPPASVDNVPEMATKKIEDGIRAYLGSLGASTKPIVDKEAVKALRGQIKGESDPIAKLRLLAALEEEEAGRVPDFSGEEAVFVAEAKAWAEAEGVPASAFQAMGVPDDVLRRAGFDVSAGSSSHTSGTSRRAPRIPLEDVEAAARKLGGGWKLADLAEVLDRDPGTARNYLNKLISEGLVSEAGDDPAHDGRGRAPKLYATSPN